MRIPLCLLLATLFALVFGAVWARAGEVPEAPSGLVTGEPNVEEIIAKETEVLEEDAGVGDPVVPDEEIFINIENLWKKADPDATLLSRFTAAILRSRAVPGSKKNEIRWERCGYVVPQEEVVGEAAKWAATFIASLERVEEQTGVKLNPWGAFATHANEAGFNECSLDFQTRKWASEHEERELITETWHGKTVTRKVQQKLVDKLRLTYDRETVWQILHDPHYKDATIITPKGKKMYLKGRSDLGPWQLRHTVKNMSRERFDRLTSMVPGIYLGAKEMARRALSFSYRYRVPDPHPRPWQLWPGWNPYAPKNLDYDAKITAVAYWLGARKDEIERGYVVIDTTRKKPRYRIEKLR